MKMRVCLISLSLIASPIAAQSWTYNPAASQAIMADVQHQALMSSMKSSPSNDSATNQDNSLSVTLTYTPTKSRTRANLQALGRRFAASDPANAAQAEQLFANNDIIDAVSGVMDQFGLERNNVAHAYAVYWVVYWGLANNVHDVPTAAAMQAVAVQAERGFTANAGFAALDNAQKQATAEELMALTAIMDATSEQAKSDPALAAQIAKASLEGSRKSGLDLDKMTLTEDGFVPVKGRKTGTAGSTDKVANPTSEPAAVAANDAGNSDTGKWAIIAAAGGAGLAGVFLFGKAMGRKG